MTFLPTRFPSSSPSPKDSVKPNSGIAQTFTSESFDAVAITLSKNGENHD